MSNIEATEEIENVFEAPQANLTDSNPEKPVLKMERFSAWGVFLLTVVTFGIYYPYWLINRAKKINLLSKVSKANLAMLYTYVALYIATIVMSAIFPEDSPMTIVNGVVSIVTMVPLLIGVFSMRRAVEEVINEGNQEPVHLGGILTFFFSAIYFQYKINEAIDNQSE